MKGSTFLLILAIISFVSALMNEYAGHALTYRLLSIETTILIVGYIIAKQLEKR